jgi:endonuclease/exonuclease/phosphatase family metal-dependent hydrolase
MTESFSLLTLNCFGLWLPDTRRRLAALAKELERRPYQVVCVQEIQLHRYQRLLVEGCPGYPYTRSEPYVHCPKGGLLTLSRIPIQSSTFVAYEERGLWYTPMLLDRLFYKGVLITKLTWNAVPIVIVNTHLLANFAGDWGRHGMYARLEEKQLRQLADTVRSQPPDSLILVAGDFNIPRGSALYRDFMAHSGLSDPLAGDSRPTLRLPVHTPSRFSLALDYALIRIPAEGSFHVSSDLCFSGKYRLENGRQGYVSDHYGIEIHLTKN